MTRLGSLTSPAESQTSPPPPSSTTWNVSQRLPLVLVRRVRARYQQVASLAALRLSLLAADGRSLAAAAAPPPAGSAAAAVEAEAAAVLFTVDRGAAGGGGGGRPRLSRPTESDSSYRLSPFGHQMSLKRRPALAVTSGSGGPDSQVHLHAAVVRCLLFISLVPAPPGAQRHHSGSDVPRGRGLHGSPGQP